MATIPPREPAASAAGASLEQVTRLLVQLAFTTKPLAMKSPTTPLLSRSFKCCLADLNVASLVYQMGVGCGNQGCTARLCATTRRRSNQRPAREYTIATARALAFSIATEPNAEDNLCQFIVERFMPAGGSDPPVGIESAIIAVAAAFHKYGVVLLDQKSTSQNLFLSHKIATFLSHTPELECLRSHSPIMKAQHTFEISVVPDGPWDARALKFLHVLGSLVDWESECDCKSDWTNMAAARQLAAELTQFWQSMLYSAADGCEDATKFCSLLDEERYRRSKKYGSSIMAQNFLRAWNGDLCVARDSKAGHALLGLTSSVLNWDVAGLHGVAGPRGLEVDIAKAISAALTDPIRLVDAWYSINNGEKLVSDTIFLGYYPSFFPDVLQINTFRGICLYRTVQALKTAQLYRTMIHKTLRAMHGMNLAAVEGLESKLLRDATNTNALVIKVRRDHLLTDTFDAFWRRQSRELFLPFRVVINSAVDQGQDQGGVSQEFFRLVMQASVDPRFGLFSVQEDSRMSWFDPLSLKPAYQYEFVGLIMALAIHNGYTLSVNFPLALYMKLCHHEVVDLGDIEDGWPEDARTRRLLRDYEKDDFDEKFFCIGFEFVHKTLAVPLAGEGETLEEVPEFVTKENRRLYIERYISCLTQGSVARQFDAFKLGFQRVLPLEVLRTVTPSVLRNIVEGESRDIDTILLERAATYGGQNDFSAESPYIRSFWHVVHNLSQDQKRLLLAFVTASDRVPANGLQSIPFVICQYRGTGTGGPEDEQSLPTASTCFGLLYLPVYRSEQVLKTKLIQALENSTGFGLI